MVVYLQCSLIVLQVAGIVGRADLLCAICVLLSLLAYMCAAATDHADDRETVAKFWLLVSVLMAAVAALCKEHGLMVMVSAQNTSWVHRIYIGTWNTWWVEGTCDG